VYYHIIHAPGASPSVSDALVWSQHNLMNSAFSQSRFRFNLKQIGRHSNQQWYTYTDFIEDVDMKSNLRVGDTTTLNVYVNRATGFCGYAYLPVDLDSIGIRDGIVVNEACFQGSILGVTLSHEAGHWLGLHHTVSIAFRMCTVSNVFSQFQDGCGGRGDQVADTTPQEGPTIGCPSSPRETTCRGGGLEPFKNIMDYASCRDRFTPGQIAKMTSDWFSYRD